MAKCCIFVIKSSSRMEIPLSKVKFKLDETGLNMLIRGKMLRAKIFNVWACSVLH